MVHWDADGRKDLLIGQADGRLKVYLNTGTDQDPHFDGGAFLQVGEPGFKSNISVGSRATPNVVDWNGDGRKDVVAGAMDGRLYLFLNEGTDEAPDFRVRQFAQDGGSDLVAPTGRSSPVVRDLDDDGRKDLLLGNTAGQLLLYTNTGTNEAPTFSGFVPVAAAGIPIDLPSSPRSRPFVCEWTGDGYTDVLIGAGDGLVHLYRGVHADTGVLEGDLASSMVVRLGAAYPNPFHPATTIPFTLSGPERVRLSVCNAAGRWVARIEERVFSEGSHEVRWHGMDDNGRLVPSGVYFVRMEAGGIVKGEKIVLLR